jgi:quercetin dioxygenase-like cupin family protein
MLTGVTIVALLSLVSLFVAPHQMIAQDRPSDLIHRFYAAANAMLASGSPAALEHVVAPDLIDHRPGTPPGDRGALAQRLADLRRAAPGVQLCVSAIVEEGEWAAARVSPVGLRPMVHGVPLDLASEPGAQTEFFRIVGGRIAEYWSGGTTINVPWALPPIVVAPWRTDTAVSLARFAFPPGAALVDLDSPGEHLILIESGELGVRLFGAASLLDAARPEVGWHAPPATGQELVLQTGDAVLIPARIRHEIANNRAEPATLLGLAMFPVAALDHPEHQESTGNSRLIAVYDPARVGTGATWDRRVSVTMLAAGIGAARSGPCVAVSRNQVSVTRFSLGPGEGLPAHPVTGLELLAIPSSGLDIAAPGLATESTLAAVPSIDGVHADTMIPRIGQGFALMPPSAASVRNTGRFPLDLIAVAIQPSGGTSCAVAPEDT